MGKYNAFMYKKENLIVRFLQMIIFKLEGGKNMICKHCTHYFSNSTNICPYCGTDNNVAPTSTINNGPYFVYTPININVKKNDFDPLDFDDDIDFSSGPSLGEVLGRVFNPLPETKPTPIKKPFSINDMHDSDNFSDKEYMDDDDYDDFDHS